MPLFDIYTNISAPYQILIYKYQFIKKIIMHLSNNVKIMCVICKVPHYFSVKPLQHQPKFGGCLRGNFFFYSSVALLHGIQNIQFQILKSCKSCKI